MPHYFVMFMVDGSTERIDCVGLEHAETIYNSINADKKSIKAQEKGKIKTIKNNH